jgi:hypothetical protein
MNGVISGGWEYVWAAYGLSVLAISTYAIAVIARLRAEQRRAAKLQPVPVRSPEGR